MAWIESHQSLRSHPKVRKLARRLDLSDVAIIGHLQCLWWWALDYAPDGSLDRHDNEDVAIGAGYDGNPDDFVKALVDVRVIDETDDGRELHDWMDYAGRLVEKRKKDAERKRTGRRQPPDVQAPSIGHPEDGARTEPTEPNLPTEPTEPSAPKRRKTALPMNWRPDKELDAWASENYPSVDIKVETQKFRNHAEANDRRLIDWRAGWRNWIINAATKYAPSNGRQPFRNFSDADYQDERI